MHDDFSLLLNDPAAYDVFGDVVRGMPAGCESYIIGGAARNAVYRRFFNEALKQRDYDQILTRQSADYLAYLRSIGFEEGGIVRADQIILYKALVPNPDRQGYDDSVVFDMHPTDGVEALTNLEQHVGFTINGFALSVRHVFDADWFDKLVCLPSSKDDLRAKRLRINKSGYAAEPANIFACLRFVSAGFAPPPKEEVALLLRELPRLDSARFTKNVPKVCRYVGSEAAVRGLAASLGIQGNILDEAQVKSGKVTVA